MEKKKKLVGDMPPVVIPTFWLGTGSLEPSRDSLDATLHLQDGAWHTAGTANPNVFAVPLGFL